MTNQEVQQSVPAKGQPRALYMLFMVEICTFSLVLDAIFLFA